MSNVDPRPDAVEDGTTTVQHDEGGSGPPARAQLDPADPHHDTTSTAVAVALAALITTVAVGGVLAMVMADVALATFDTAAAEFGAALSGDAATVWWLRRVTDFGGTAFVVWFGVWVAAIASWWRRDLRVATYLGAVTIAQFSASNAVKWIVQRDRPDLEQLVGHAGSSFPSGHATAVAATFAAYAWLATRWLRRRDAGRLAERVVAIVAVGICLAVAASRVLLGVHWLTDVVAGLFLGWGTFLVVTLVHERLRPLAVGEEVTR